LVLVFKLIITLLFPLLLLLSCTKDNGGVVGLDKDLNSLCDVSNGTWCDNEDKYSSADIFPGSSIDGLWQCSSNLPELKWENGNELNITKGDEECYYFVPNPCIVDSVVIINTTIQNYATADKRVEDANSICISGVEIGNTELNITITNEDEFSYTRVVRINISS